MSDTRNPQKELNLLLESIRQSEEYDVQGTMLQFTEALFSAMEQREMNKTDLADKLGKSKAFVTKVLRGDANPTLRTLISLCRALGQRLELRLTPVGHDSVADGAVIVRNRTQSFDTGILIIYQGDAKSIPSRRSYPVGSWNSVDAGMQPANRFWEECRLRSTMVKITPTDTNVEAEHDERLTQMGVQRFA